MFKLYVKNKDQKVTRSLLCSKKSIFVIFRKDINRLEFTESLSFFESQKIPFDLLKKIDEADFKKDLFFKGQIISLAKDEDPLDGDIHLPEIHDPKVWNQCLVSSIIASFLLSLIILFYPTKQIEEEEKKQEHSVQIIKPKKPKKYFQSGSDRISKAKKSRPNVKRLGALAVLGQLKKSSAQLGGVNLSAAKSSSGIGLGGGTKGSGGVQTSLYGKGLLKAPLGSGANIQGGGGYGTKGKAGGKAGYGKLSLVGSSGANLIPLGKEAVVEGGLDQNAIFLVIQKNMGQIRFCYEQELQGNPSLSGRVGVQFTIRADGSVKQAKISSSSLKSANIQDCILRRIKSWKFPLPRGGVEVNVSYPFLLRRKIK